MKAHITVAAGDVQVANEWATGDMVPRDDGEGYALPVTPLVLRTREVAVALRGTREEHREVVRRMAALVGLATVEAEG